MYFTLGGFIVTMGFKFSCYGSIGTALSGYDNIFHYSNANFVLDLIMNICKFYNPRYKFYLGTVSLATYIFRVCYGE